jgi:Golgi nucleoside diphosphatase
LVDKDDEVNQLILELVNEASESRLSLSILSNTIIGKFVPKSHIEQTGISLKATAGLRQLDQLDQDWLIAVVRNALAMSGFDVDPLETRVIDGREEAFFGWMTVAIAFKIHQTIFSAPQMKYFGALDMGGASKQIAFILREESSEQCTADWRLRSQGILIPVLHS